MKLYSISRSSGQGQTCDTNISPPKHYKAHRIGYREQARSFVWRASDFLLKNSGAVSDLCKYNAGHPQSCFCLKNWDNQKVFEQPATPQKDDDKPAILN